MSSNIEEEVSLKEVFVKVQDWLNYFRSKFLWILIAGVLGGSIGIIYAVIQTPIYKAEVSFVAEGDNSSGGLSGALGLASQFGLDLGGSGDGAFTGENLMELMKSRSMIEKALLATVTISGKKRTLADFYMRDLGNKKNGSEEVGVKFLPGADREVFTRRQDSVLGVLYKSLISGPLAVEKKDKKLSIISVVVNSPNELFSKLFAETLVKEVSDFYIETKTKRSAENLAILQYQTDSVRAALNSAISQVAVASDVNPNANISRQVLRVPSQRRSIDVLANQELIAELFKHLEVAKITLRKETPFIQIINRPVMPLEIDRPSKKQSLLIGGFLCGFLMVVFLLFKRILQNLQ